MMTRFPTGMWAVALIASVLLNGLALGVVAAGAATGLRVVKIEREADDVRPLRVLDEGLPEGMRDDVRERMREHAAQARPLFGEARAANESVMQALSADPFDEAAVRAAFARAGAAREALHDHANEATIAMFSRLSPEMRASFVERGRMSGFEWRGGGDGRRGGGYGDGRGRGGPPPPFGPMTP